MARGEQSDAVLDEIGLSFLDVGASAARVFGGVIGETPAEPGEEEELSPGWVAVATRAAAMFQAADDQDITLSFSQFGQMLRRAYARGANPDEDLPDFDTLPRPVQVGWVAVARHAANVFNFEAAESRKLESHEGAIVDWAKAQLHPEGTP